MGKDREPGVPGVDKETEGERFLRWSFVVVLSVACGWFRDGSVGGSVTILWVVRGLVMVLDPFTGWFVESSEVALWPVRRRFRAWVLSIRFSPVEG